MKNNRECQKHYGKEKILDSPPVFAIYYGIHGGLPKTYDSIMHLSLLPIHLLLSAQRQQKTSSEIDGNTQYYIAS